MSTTLDTVDEQKKPPIRPGLRFGNVVSFVWRPWPVAVTLFLALVAFIAFCASIRLGAFPMTFGEVLQALTGTGDSTTHFIVMELRMPRALVGLVVGAALGMSGAIVQSIARNPLASPDILGVTAGAGVAAVFLVTSTGTLAATLNTDFGLPVVAVTGGLVTGGLVYLLAVRGGVDGMRLILVGIAITFLMRALVDWMLVRADIRDVARAQTWLVGSLESRDWSDVWTALGLGVPAAVIALAAAFPLRAVQLGDDVALGLGVRLGFNRAVLLIASVLLASAAVAAAGPIGFIAFVSPQLAMRLTRLPTPPLIPSALMGAALLSCADLAARTLFAVALPVGIITAAVGGPFLVYLLVRQNLKGAK
ncbi:FecCD family ABC transporter permease [Tsukamurella ocularis]|uniref:FecCD family ABC transporter permease n=1 Tax=Tsukamurella ocularis TaxID=1970234 RepID=UPI002168DC5E|nr:iron chelate uptake ABC transporter family permease subunit [Tsukamurella ocularis]MCS3778833.1 iron complex transport system permease protein [Tsukamurella ocularis]MCS3787547.1 iron complex transport system permease protein [Tsukamurella ocularis]MCS3851516.1 iron complex transport system permease protein [Tsukamurella ocularis]